MSYVGFCDYHEEDNTQYKQCLLKLDNNYQVALIPLVFAVKNKILKIKENDEIKDGWKVVQVYDTILYKGYQYRNQRKYLPIKRCV